LAGKYRGEILAGTYWRGHIGGDILVGTYWRGHIGGDILAGKICRENIGVKLLTLKLFPSFYFEVKKNEAKKIVDQVTFSS
jgi:hypothetical protein